MEAESRRFYSEAAQNAFVEVMRNLGLNPDPSPIGWERQFVEDGYRSAVDLLQQTTRPTALVIGANQQTSGALQAIRDLGLKISLSDVEAT